MAKALKIAAVVVGAAALAVVTGGAALGLGIALSTTAFGISASALLLTSALLSTAGSLLSPKPKSPSVSGSNADRLQVSVDLRTPRKIIVGSTAMATDLRDQEWSADQSELHRFIVAASHKAHAIREIWFDSVLAWTAAGGVQGAYVGYLTVVPVLEGSAANAINIGFRMGSSRRYTGCAYVYLRYKLTGNSKKTESPFASSVPTRVTIVGDGIDVYDPRLDSTAGGSGAHRAVDQATWAWTDSQARNPALQMLVYLLGWRINGKLAVGKGIPAARIDLASFITAANLCDEMVTKGGGTEPRYRSDGIFSEADDPSLVLDNFKASMNAVLDDVDGKIRVTVLHNDLATPIGSLVSADVLGEFSWSQTAALTDSVNVIRGGYTDPTPASLYQLVDYPEVAIASPDGIDRSQAINLPLIQSPTQAQRLVRQRLARAQYGGTFTAVFQATAWKFQKGDVIAFTFYPLGFDAKLFRIADMAIQVDGTVPLTLREEHPDIYAAYDNPAAAVEGVAPTVYDPTLWPVSLAIEDASGTADWDGVTGAGKPDDNADVTGEHTAADTAAVGGRPTATVLSQIDQAIVDIDLVIAQIANLDAGEAGSAILQAAEAARDVAVAAKTNSETARDQSQAARDASSAAAALAEQLAAAAAQSVGDASGFATTASGQATIATQQATAAGQQAVIATAQADIATTSAGQAEVFSQSAAVSESNALGSKIAAAASAGVSASAKNAAQALLDSQFPPVLDPVGRASYESPFGYSVVGPDSGWPTRI
ncbi:MAG TPA: hypothetical protein VF638_05630 [Sphingomonas sp.]